MYEPFWTERQRRLGMRPDAQRYVRPDFVHHLRPGAEGALLRQLYGRKDAAARAAGTLSVPAIVVDPATEADLVWRRHAIARLRLDWELLKFSLRGRKAGFDPSQARVPAGTREGGQWTSEGGEGTPLRPAESNLPLDDDGTPYYKPGGHHEVPKAVYGKWNLPPETAAVFKNGTTGKMPQMLLRTTPDGVPVGHLWDGSNGAHGIYNQAVDKLGRDFMSRNGITGPQMTPDHAWALLKEIRETDEPIIRDYNKSMRLLRRLGILRIWRGRE